MVRGALGCTNWVQRESRLDAVGDSSIIMSRLNQSTVQDLCDCNAMIKRIQEDPHLGIILLAIPLSLFGLQQLFLLRVFFLDRLNNRVF